MVQGLERLQEASGSLIVYANHSSWWDPLMLVLMAQTVRPGLRHYAPMDAAALARYPIFRKLGIFPVEMSTARGAAMFLRTGKAVLQSGGVLWLTPQGRFADPRSSPLAFKPGIGALAERMPGVPLLPMAVEYTFWDERLPEALVRFGEAVHVVGNQAGHTPMSQLEEALAREMLALQTASLARDARAFTPVLSGARGTGGLYGWARQVRALFTGKRLQQDHTARPGS